MISNKSLTLENAINIAQDGASSPGWSDADVEALKRELADLRAARNRESRANKPIFSGDYSREMWAEIGSANTVGELSRALHSVCCRMQELEARLTQEEWVPYVEQLRKRERALDDTGQHYISGIPLARLEIRHDGDVVGDFELTVGRTIIGRTSGNDLTIPSKEISKHHAQIVTDLKHCVLEDLKSTNGVYVGRKRVGSHQLKDGNIIAVGKHKILYRNLRAKKLDSDLTEKKRGR